MDRGSLSCGYYQIKLPYYKDCGEPDDYACTTACVEIYYYRFNCPGKSDCESMARLHNGRPSECYSSSTYGYWDRMVNRSTSTSYGAPINDNPTICPFQLLILRCTRNIGLLRFPRELTIRATP
uniref:lysozyme n=1 Tax=Strongyloides venezuelensis TaxID=75913 RepID=A0A0K0EW43_STRVS